MELTATEHAILKALFLGVSTSGEIGQRIGLAAGTVYQNLWRRLLRGDAPLVERVNKRGNRGLYRITDAGERAFHDCVVWEVDPRIKGRLGVRRSA
jgi:DNA-binding PadR family transcriptional regulator